MGRWLRGEEEAFDTLYRRYVMGVMKMIAQKTGCTPTARDLTQDVFVEFYLQKEKLGEVSNVKAYIFSIAKHKVLNYFRQQLVQEKYRQAILHRGDRDTAAPIVEVLEKRELLRIITDEIAVLPPKCREVFLLSREEKLSYSAIARKMSISENTVDQHIRKALCIIRSALNEYNASLIE